MKAGTEIALLGIFLVLPGLTQARTARETRHGPLVAVELKVRETTFDACMNCGCRAKGELELGQTAAWWVSYGLVMPDSKGGWRAASAASHCGAGSFGKVAADFRTTVGTPYVVWDLSTVAPAAPDGEIGLDLRIRGLSGFDTNGQPLYVSSTHRRAFSLTGAGDLVLPLLIPDPNEQEAFGVYEVLLRLRATLLGTERAVYGSLAVSADVPGAEILFDGRLVGRIGPDAPTLLENILVGSRNIRVRDFSGREAGRKVKVKQDKTAGIHLKILKLGRAAARQKLISIGKNPQGYEEFWRTQDSALLVRIPAGEFLMGSPEGEGEPHEKPQRRVWISEFLIDKTEVTWRQFQKFAEATGTPVPAAPLWGTPDHYPAASVIWEEARAYCEWVGGRLPTEAEWEKAARGTDGSRYLWGEDWDPDRCNARDGGPHRPLGVGSFPACVSPYGVLDMAGSAWEWCADWYGESYYAEGPFRDPTGPASGSQRVLRGGAWMTPYTWLRAAYRYKGDPTWRRVDRGFRCVLEAGEK